MNAMRILCYNLSQGLHFSGILLTLIDINLKISVVPFDMERFLHKNTLFLLCFSVKTTSFKMWLKQNHAIISIFINPLICVIRVFFIV
jgi:hypothetical protein